VAALGLSDAVRLVERQPRELMPTYLAMASVVVSTRTGGGNLPLKIFDYLAAGRPIVATDIAAHRAVLTTERAVLVAPEPRALAEAITALLADRSRAARLADRARAYAASTLGWPAFVASVRELYEDVMARPWAGNGEPPVPLADARGHHRIEGTE
jgi:glycosyltransferase involved in cell wall biosynthesis